MRVASVACFAGLLTALAAAGDSGLEPRPASTDYPASKPAKAASIGAALVSASQVKKFLPVEISKKYVVVEVAVYPQAGASVDVAALDFALKFGPDEIRYPSTPKDVAAIWKEDQPSVPGHGTEVHGSTGATYGTGTDATGRRTRTVGTDQEVNGTIGSPLDMPPPPQYDPYVVEAAARQKALPEGATTNPVAGYLYFPAPAKKPKKAALELRYSKDGEVVTLSLPSK